MRKLLISIVLFVGAIFSVAKADSIIEAEFVCIIDKIKTIENNKEKTIDITYQNKNQHGLNGNLIIMPTMISNVTKDKTYIKIMKMGVFDEVGADEGGDFIVFQNTRKQDRRIFMSFDMKTWIMAEKNGDVYMICTPLTIEQK